MIVLKTKDQIKQIKECGKILGDALNKAVSATIPGVTTEQLNNIIEDHILSCGATPSFKGYGGTKNREPFPKAICLCVNEQLIHGIPSGRIIKEGDLISIDIGVTKNECIADSCYSYCCGTLSLENQKLLDAAKEITLYGISLVKPNLRIFDLARLVAEKAAYLGFITMPDMYGHGTGYQLLHSPPTLPFTAPPYKDSIINHRFAEGMVVTIEPVIAYPSSKGRYKEGKDGWVLVTEDGSYSAQFEHTILVTTIGAEVLTSPFK